MKYKNHDTPCIGICSTIYGDDLCRGCKRSSNEVIHWNTSSPTEKDMILQRLDQLTAQVTAKSIIITDQELLKSRLNLLFIRFRQEFSPYTWAYNLLRAHADRITDIAEFGIEVKNEYQNLSFRQLIDAIDDELFKRSSEHLND